MDLSARFGASVCVGHQAEVQYAYIRLVGSSPDTVRGAAAGRVRALARHVLFAANDESFFVVALSRAEIDALRRHPGVAVAGGVSIDVERLLASLQPTPASGEES